MRTILHSTVEAKRLHNIFCIKSPFPKATPPVCIEKKNKRRFRFQRYFEYAWNLENKRYFPNKITFPKTNSLFRIHKEEANRRLCIPEAHVKGKLVTSIKSVEPTYSRVRRASCNKQSSHSINLCANFVNNIFFQELNIRFSCKKKCKQILCVYSNQYRLTTLVEVTLANTRSSPPKIPDVFST